MKYLIEYIFMFQILISKLFVLIKGRNMILGKKKAIPATGHEGP
jgi:hypothetical protein